MCALLTEEAIARLVRSAVFERGRMMAQRHGRIWSKSCNYSGAHTVVRANIDSASGYQESYHVLVKLSEQDNEVAGYGCDCPAASRFSGPCKHAVALTLDFIRNPSAYEGWSELAHVSTSPALLSFLDRAQAQLPLRSAAADTDAPGSVRLIPTLGFGEKSTLSLRVAGSQGSYVVKSLSSFVDDIAEGFYRSYGKKLSFTHSREAFVREDRPLVDFVRRCVLNRRAYAGSRIGYSVSAVVGKSMSLSAPEMDELLHLYLGKTLQVEPIGRLMADKGKLIECFVCEGDPELGLEVLPAADNCFELRRVRSEKVELVSNSEQLYALAGKRLLICSPRMEAAASFLTSVYCSSSQSLMMTEKDARRFAASVLPRIEGALELSLPPEIEKMRPEPCVVRLYIDRAGRAISCDARACYGEKSYPLFSRLSAEELDAGVYRDQQLEAQAREVVGRYFTASKDTTLLLSRADAESVARLVFEGIGELSRVAKLYTTEAFEHVARSSRPRGHIAVSLRAGLIDLSVGSSDIPAAELHAVLESYRQKKRYHRLRDGSFVHLEEAELAELARVAEGLGLSARELAQGEIQVPSYKAFLLNSLVSDEEKDASFERYIEDFRSADMSAYEPPSSLAEVLRGYQADGFCWLSALADMGFGGILADEMGLGKSIQLISFLLARRGRGATLIVCPASLVYNWQAEFAQFAPTMDVAVVAGTAQERYRTRLERGHEVFITSYDLLRRDVEEWARMRLWCQVLDEAQFIKNHTTLAARATKSLEATHRFALTGTPVENRLSELWSIFDFLMPGLLGSYDRFRERYEEAIVAGDEEVSRQLRDAVSPFILRRLKKDVLHDLPDKLEEVVTCRMEGEQRKLYQAREQMLRHSLAHQGDAEFSGGKLQLLSELTRLRQICCDPSLIYEDYAGGSAKLDTIWQLVSSAAEAGVKVLVFSQFTSFLSLIAERLDAGGVAYYRIVGSTPKKRRLELVDAFNADDVPVFLVSLRAGGTGLNLVGASVVIHADPWWNAAAQDQATDRAHRIGQTREVTVYKVIAANTIEERILMMQELKADLAKSVVPGETATTSLARLRREDLLELLGD